MTESSTGEPRTVAEGSATRDGHAAQPAPRGEAPDARSTAEPPAEKSEGKTEREPPRLVRRLRERREAYHDRGRAYRVAWVTAGVIVIVAGLVMVVFPGPALVVIPIGLAMLSLEFAWAERLLDSTLERGIDAKDMALNASRRQKIVGIAAIACAIAAAVAVALIYFV